MRLVYPGDQTDWALLDGDEDRVMRHLAGGLAVWAPRVAYGEGRAALPINGRREPWRATAPLLAGRHFRRVFPGATIEAGEGLAAVVGAAPMGRPNPLRCVVGYVAVKSRGGDGSPAFGPVLVTAGAFGHGGPALVGAPSAEEQLRIQDGGHDLRTGDVVILGRALLSAELWAALQNDVSAVGWLAAAATRAQRGSDGAAAGGFGFVVENCVRAEPESDPGGVHPPC